MSNQKHLWAPWKMDYLENKKGDSQKIFLDKANESNDRENLILHRSNNCYVIMNYYPYNNGHLMVVPYNEVDRFEDLEDATLSEIITLSKNNNTIPLNPIKTPNDLGIESFSSLIKKCARIDPLRGVVLINIAAR